MTTEQEEALVWALNNSRRHHTTEVKTMQDAFTAILPTLRLRLTVLGAKVIGRNLYIDASVRFSDSESKYISETIVVPVDHIGFDDETVVNDAMEKFISAMAEASTLWLKAESVVDKKNPDPLEV